MKLKVLVAFVLLFWGVVGGAQPRQAHDVNELLEQVRKTIRAEDLENTWREQRFLAEKDAQKRRLKTVAEALAAERERSGKLQRAFEKNADKVASLEEKLQPRSGALLEMFGVVRQVAGDALAVVDDSLVSTQIRGRSDAVEQLAKSDRLPSIEQLEALWFALQQEMTEERQVA